LGKGSIADITHPDIAHAIGISSRKASQANSSDEAASSMSPERGKLVYPDIATSPAATDDVTNEQAGSQ